MARQRIVIVGASLAGATAAATLRDEGFDGDIRLIGAEAQLPYNRPPLSKGYLRQQERFEDQLVKPAGYYAEQRIQLTLGVRATAVFAKQRLVDLEGGERVAYDRLLVTTGGRNRTLSVPGATLEGVFQLRTVADCDRIRAATRRARRAVVMGLGFIGSEVSASLRQLGIEVTAVEGARVPLARVVGEEVGQVLTAIHREKGVELVLEDSVSAFEGSGRVERVRTKKGRVLECDMVVAGIGIVPNIELLAAAGARVDNGVLVDERCRTSLPDVFAAGDVTNHLIRSSAACASSTGTTDTSRDVPRPGHCWATSGPTTTSIPSGRISTSTPCSTSGSRRAGTASCFVVGPRVAASSASTSRMESCVRWSVSTGAAIRRIRRWMVS